MSFVTVITIILYIVLAIWIWHNLGGIEKAKKVGIIVIGILIIYFITSIIFSFSKQGIVYENLEIAKIVKNTIVIIFTGVNGLILLPYIAKILDKINENEIEKNTFIKSLTIIAIIFVVCIFLETGYMKSTQQGILQIYNSIN